MVIVISVEKLSKNISDDSQDTQPLCPFFHHLDVIWHLVTPPGLYFGDLPYHVNCELNDKVNYLLTLAAHGGKLAELSVSWTYLGVRSVSSTGIVIIAKLRNDMLKLFLQAVTDLQVITTRGTTASILTKSPKGLIRI